MPEFVADIRDIKFALFEQAGFERLFQTRRFGDLDRDTAEAILDEAYKFARQQLGPINPTLDAVGARFDKTTAKVTLPEGVHPAYELFFANGWATLSNDVAWGGQGMPYSLDIACKDMFFGGCLSFNLLILLNSGVAHLIEAFGSEELEKTFLPKLYSGEWTGTMCLTEPGAGSDVGASRTRARKDGDHYLIVGEKIFITFGEHDLTDNICHAVLARVEGAPEGTRGLSLFLVPKRRVRPDGTLGELNDVVCAGIEHKMGIHASPTCTMRFGENGRCHGWLLGEEGKGMSAMFQMMNEARIQVGLQGSALANAAYQYALGYARQRVQGKDLAGKPTSIIQHPDVRQMLLWQKAWSEGTRALLLRTAMLADLAASADDEAERAEHHGLLQVLTPICKAYGSDISFRSIELSMQTLGGYGYLKEYPVEQYLRDTKIASIYEGTNGIQALDLVGRKLGLDGGAHMKRLVGMMTELAQTHESHPQLGEDFAHLSKAIAALVEITRHFAKAGGEDRVLTILDATPYLDVFGQVTLGWLLLEQATLALPALQAICDARSVELADAGALAALCEKDEEARFYQGKLRVAQFYARRALSLCPSKAKALQAGDRSPLEVVL